MNQLTMDFTAAREAGLNAATRSLDKAHRANPEFGDRARAAIVAHLAAHGPCSGEVLTNICKEQGICPPKDDRAFGGVFLSLSAGKEPRIRCIRSDLPRARGHGTSGGKLWGLIQ